jgi:hypothetical protein
MEAQRHWVIVTVVVVPSGDGGVDRAGAKGRHRDDDQHCGGNGEAPPRGRWRCMRWLTSGAAMAGGFAERPIRVGASWEQRTLQKIVTPESGLIAGAT